MTFLKVFVLMSAFSMILSACSGSSETQSNDASSQEQFAQDSAAEEVSEGDPPSESNELEYPFKAYLRCHYGNLNQALQICLGNGAAGTTLELVNGEGSGVFTNIDVMRRKVGNENRSREIEIDLLRSFSLKIQNAATPQLLSVRIVDQATGEQVFEGSAAQYEFVAVGN